MRFRKAVSALARWRSGRSSWTSWLCGAMPPCHPGYAPAPVNSSAGRIALKVLPFQYPEGASELEELAAWPVPGPPGRYPPQSSHTHIGIGQISCPPNRTQLLRGFAPSRWLQWVPGASAGVDAPAPGIACPPKRNPTVGHKMMAA